MVANMSVPGSAYSCKTTAMVAISHVCSAFILLARAIDQDRASDDALQLVDLNDEFKSLPHRFIREQKCSS